jgi:hypothetical protein
MLQQLNPEDHPQEDPGIAITGYYRSSDGHASFDWFYRPDPYHTGPCCGRGALSRQPNGWRLQVWATDTYSSFPKALPPTSAKITIMVWPLASPPGDDEVTYTANIGIQVATYPEVYGLDPEASLHTPPRPTTPGVALAAARRNLAAAQTQYLAALNTFNTTHTTTLGL